MNVFKVWRGYRKIGLGYGLPVCYIDFGIGVPYNVEQLAEKVIVREGVPQKSWVVLRYGLGEKGLGTFIYALKQLQIRVEMECSTFGICPGWFPSVDRWVVFWEPDGRFNLSALRPRQDIVVYIGEDIEGFLNATKDAQALRGIIVDYPDKVWDLVKDYEVRVYSKYVE